MTIFACAWNFVTIAVNFETCQQEAQLGLQQRKQNNLLYAFHVTVGQLLSIAVIVLSEIKGVGWGNKAFVDGPR